MRLLLDPLLYMDRVRPVEGDCVDVLSSMRPRTVDAVVADPPYGLGFMGKEWDTFRPDVIDREMLRDGKTQEIRRSDPKYGRTISRAIAAARYDYRVASNREYQRRIEDWSSALLRVAKPGAHLAMFGAPRTWHRLVCGIEDAGWEIRDCMIWLRGGGLAKSLTIKRITKQEMHHGLGTGLKPGWEPVCLARAPLDGTVSSTVSRWGTGALNVASCEIPVKGGGRGRHPPNVLLDEDAAKDLDAQSGLRRSGFMRAGTDQHRTNRVYNGIQPSPLKRDTIADVGGASRFFFCGRASKKEKRGSTHPTVKPLSLIRWIVRLVCPPGGIVLDPCGGRGTTMEASWLEGRRCVVVEREPVYAAEERALAAALRGGGA